MTKTFSPSYHNRLRSQAWRDYGKMQRSLWCGRDALLPLLPCHDIEHLTYSNLGHEWFIRDTIPLNKHHHRKFVTPLRRLTKGGKRRVTAAQRAMTWMMRAWALIMLPFIWLIWGRMWALCAGVAIALWIF
ncbi:MAG: hypothetical protein AAF327_18050 [Cyanobacteria bacterium P01_A01_bin.37]